MEMLFSEHWHLVRYVKPKLREAVEAFPRRLRGRSWIFLHDQLTQKFLRLTPEAWLIIKKMDGQTDLETIWETSCLEQQQLHEAHRFYHDKEPQIIGQHDLVNLLSQLYSNDMLQTQMSADATEIVKRFKKQRFQNFKQSYLNPISIKIPLWYPDQWFDKQSALAIKLYSWTFLLLWFIVVAPAVFLAWSHWSTLTNNLSDRVLSTSNLFILWCTYPIVKSVHEWAHGMAVKAWGGIVREIGLMLIIFMPVPYVDATYAYRFPSKWARALVAAAGIMAELFLGALAIYVWLNAESGLISAFAFNVIFIAGFSSLLVNGNPLMRYDGYYVFSNLIESPNLSQRAKNYWVYLSDKYYFGAKDAKPPIGHDVEKGWLFIYGLVAPIYRISIIFGIIWFIAQKYFVIGVIMAFLSAWMSFVIPIYKGLKHIFKGQSLMKKRVQAKRRLYLMLLLLSLVIFALPAPFYTVQQGVVWVPEQNIVRTSATGTVKSVFVDANQQVQSNQSLLLLTNRDLQQKSQQIFQQLTALSLQIRQAQTTDVGKYNELLAQQKALLAEQSLVQKDIDVLTISAPNNGVWYPKVVNEFNGSFVKKGDVLGYVVPEQGHIIKVVIAQDDMSLINERLKRIDIKTVTDMNDNYHANIIRKTPKAGFVLPSPALGANAGGDIVIDPSDQAGTKSVERVFDVEIALVDIIKTEQPVSFNDRMYVRFYLGNLPYGWQWFIRIQQLFLKKFDV